MDVYVRHDKEAKLYTYGFDVEGSFVPLGNLPESTVKSHVTRVTDTDRKQFPQKDD